MEFNLKRFLVAQEPVFESALGELRAGNKMGHWMWFIFPQIVGLGGSSMSRLYAIRSLEEARVYLQHKDLGPRLVACCEAILSVEGKSAHEILGSPDDLKLRSSTTLFSAISEPGSIFHQVLDRFFDGQPDEKTVAILRDQTSAS